MCLAPAHDPATQTLAPYLPMFDPEHFHDVAFFAELAKIGYRQVLIGGTGSGPVSDLVRGIRARAGLQVVLVPGSPAAVTDADLIVLPDVMNSNSHYARPFGSGSVATAAAVAAAGVPFLPVAYFILGRSTARWYFDAFDLPSDSVLLAYARYAQMIGYRDLALDYEGPSRAINPKLISQLAAIPGLRLRVSDELDAAGAAALLELGVDTVITPSDIYEEHADPLAHAAAMHTALLR